MAKQELMNEVDVLRYFEAGPIEKVEVVFNIVREKMRERLKPSSLDNGEAPARIGTRKRSGKTLIALQLLGDERDTVVCDGAKRNLDAARRESAPPTKT